HMVREHTDDFTGNGKVNVLVQMNRHPLAGYAGGRPGVGNYYLLDYGGPSALLVDEWVFEHPTGPNRAVFAQRQGGGGWGRPYERDPAALREGLRDEDGPHATARRH